MANVLWERADLVLAVRLRCRSARQGPKEGWTNKRKSLISTIVSLIFRFFAVFSGMSKEGWALSRPRPTLKGLYHLDQGRPDSARAYSGERSLSSSTLKGLKSRC